MTKSLHNRLITSTISIIFLCMTQSTKCLHEDPRAKTNDTDVNNVKTKTSAVALTPKEVAMHNQNAATVVNELLPPTAKPTAVDKPVTQDSMGGGIDLGVPSKSLKNQDFEALKALRTGNKASFTDPDDSVSNHNYEKVNGVKVSSYQTADRSGRITDYNEKYQPTNVSNRLTDGSIVATKLHPETGQKLSTTISTPPVKTGWFSTAKSSTVIEHNDDGTHTATTTTTTSNLFSPLFGDKSEVTAVVKINKDGIKAAPFTPGTKTSRSWNGSTTTTTVHADGSTSTQVKNLFGTPISASGNESNGSKIDSSAPYNVE